MCVCGDTLSVELVYQPLNHQAQGHEIDPARPAAVAALWTVCVRPRSVLARSARAIAHTVAEYTNPQDTFYEYT